MLKKMIPLILTVLLALSIAGCTNTPAESTPTGTPDSSAPAGSGTAGSAGEAVAELELQFGDSDPFIIHLYENDTAAKIAEYVGTAAWQLPIYHYDDYEGWEVMQYYDVPSRYEIPSNPETVTEEAAGTVYYSEPNRLILFYQDAEISGEYTPVGYIDYSEELLDAVENNLVVPGWSNKLIHISTGE